MSSRTFNELKKYMTIENILFTIVLLIILFYFLVQVVVLQSANPQVAVETTSMVPTYQGYDFHESITGGPNDLFRGDVLLVQNKDPMIGDGQMTLIV